MSITTADIQPVWLTLQLSSITVVVLLMLGTPLAWWLACTRSRLKIPVEAITALPLVLPPTVLGFYLLILLGANGILGQTWMSMFGHPLSFTFTGLVIASCIYSLPFVVQPLQTVFESIDHHTSEAAWTLGANRLKTFFTVVLPQSRRGVLTAIVLGFSHTMGEFGVILMVGGNIPGKTQVISIAIYEQVEQMDYATAHLLSFGLLTFSFVVLSIVYSINRRWHFGMSAA